MQKVNRAETPITNCPVAPESESCTVRIISDNAECLRYLRASAYIHIVKSPPPPHALRDQSRTTALLEVIDCSEVQTARRSIVLTESPGQ